MRGRGKGEIDGRREGRKGEETTVGAQPFIRRSKVTVGLHDCTCTNHMATTCTSN